jgi:hypothetical protein
VFGAAYTFTAADQGQKTFRLAWDTQTPTGARTLTVRAELTGGATTELVFAVQLNDATTTGLEVTGWDEPPVVGVPDVITATAYTAGGTVDTTYRGTVFFSYTCTVAGCVGATPDPYTFTAADNGVKTFSVLWTAADCAFVRLHDIGLGGANDRDFLNLTCADAAPPPTTPTTSGTTPTTSGTTPTTVKATATTAAGTPTTATRTVATIPITGSSRNGDLTAIAFVFLGAGLVLVGRLRASGRDGSI